MTSEAGLVGAVVTPSLSPFWIGLWAASALPLGALLGLWWAPSSRMTAAVMAFGSGSLVAALTLELVVEALHRAGFWPMALGAMGGGGIFLVLNHWINARGGFLRKSSTTNKAVRQVRHYEASRIVKELSRISIFQALPPEEVSALVPFVHRRVFPAGTLVVQQGEPGESLFLLVEGRAEVIHEVEIGTGESTIRQQQSVAALGPGDVFGEMALLTGEVRTATVKASTSLEVLEIQRDDFQKAVERSVHLRTAVEALRSRREHVLERVHAQAGRQTERWLKHALHFVRAAGSPPTAGEVKAAAQSHGSAPLAIGLGTLLDGIPESLVVGASLVGASTVNLSLVAGIFLSNFPESLSSAVGMKRIGYGGRAILGMWTGLMLLTGIGSWAGYYFFQTASPALFAMLEGAAAGAMLTMVAETMLPEAFEQQSSVVGFSTLLGFLTTVFLKSLHG